MKKLFLLLVTVISIGLCASAQTRTVTGTVVDAATEEPLIGASVSAGHGVGVATDVDGNFAIQVPQAITKLTVSYIGYHSLVVDITAGKMLVKLQPSSEALNEVFAVAYGVAKKSEYTGAASVVKADKLADALVSDVTNALGGKVSGLQTYSDTGQPGTTASVRIRGTGSINTSTEPLYVVDGMPFQGDVATIPAQDIESMTVLKDAASTALYGARGANGVILITTKRGKEGEARVTFDARWGSNSRAIPNYDVITDQRQYLEMTWRQIYNSQINYAGKTPEAASAYAAENVWSGLGYQTWTAPDGQSFFDANGKFNPNATPGYSDGMYYYIADDWEKESLMNGFRQEYNLSVSGGNERLQYYVSGSYLGDEGIIRGSHFNRLSTRFAADYQAKDWLKIGTTMSYVYTNTGNPGDQTNDTPTSSGNVFYFVNGLGPVYPMYVRNPDGKIKYNTAYGLPIYDYGDGKDYGNGRMNSARNPSGNPRGQLQYDVADYLNDAFDAKWYATLTPIEGLNITQTVGYNLSNNRTHQVLNSLYGQFADQGGQIMQIAERYRDITLQTLVTYSRTFNDVHYMNLMGGYESEDYKSEFVEGLRDNLYQPGVPFLNNAIDNPKSYGAESSLAHRGFLVRGEYSYDSRYRAMVSFRRDGSSRFAPGRRWGSFWSASAGWDIAKEAFMEELTPTVDLLKLRASFGQNGNDRIGSNFIAYADQYRMTGGNGVFSDAELAYPGNPDITWEKSNSFNVGVDFSFWQGKLSGAVEYYNRQTDDMLFRQPVAPSTGYPYIPINAGSMRNNGFELELNYRPIDTKDVKWELYGNITFQWNKILSLPDDIMGEYLTGGDGKNPEYSKAWVYSSSQIRREGHSLYDLYLPQYAGVDPETGESLFWSYPRVEYTDPATGEAKVGYDFTKPMEKTAVYTDASNSGRTFHSMMPLAYGGFGTKVEAFGVDVALAFSYQFGGQLIDYGYMDAMSTGNFGSAMHKDLLNSWSPTNTKTDVPAVYTDANRPYATALSDRFLVSSDYLALNEVSLGYTLPTKWVSKFGIGSVRIYGAAKNVALWSKRKGLDPRQGYLSSENMTYAPMRAISGGINVTF